MRAKKKPEVTPAEFIPAQPGTIGAIFDHFRGRKLPKNFIINANNFKSKSK